MQRRVTRATSVRERLLEEARNFREEARLLPSGAVRDVVLKRSQQSEAAAHMEDLLVSGLMPMDDPPTKEPR